MIKLTKRAEIPIITLILSLLFIAIQLLTGTNYPIFRDELYYLDCANHPAFGYVDHPPLSIWILIVWKFIFGDSQFSIRIIPAICGALLLIITSLITRELGGNKPAQIFSSVTVFSGLYFIATGGFYSMNVGDSLFWALLFLILVKIVKNSPKSPPYQGGYIRTLWLLFGITAGFGLMNKISVGYLGLGILSGILLTKNHVWLKQKYFWLSGIIALVIFSPYVIWNAFNDFPTIQFIQNARQFKIAAVSPLDFMKEQVLLINPLSAPVWIAGLIALLFGRLKPFRLIGISYMVILVLLIVMRSKAYYLAAIYPVLIAAGGVVFNPERSRRIGKALLYSYMFLLLLSTAVFSPMVIPVLPPEQAAEHIKRLGIMPSSGEVMRQSELPQILADRFGWEEMTEKAAKIYHSLPDSEKQYTGIYGNNYGEAGAINYYGRRYGLPRCICGHNSHYLWGPQDDSVNAMIIIGGRKEDHLKNFTEVTEMDRTNSPFAMPFENNKGIFLARGLKMPIKEVWARVKEFI